MARYRVRRHAHLVDRRRRRPNALLRQLPAPGTIAASDLAARLADADAAISTIQELLGEVRTSHDELRRTLDDLKRDRDEWRGRAERLTERPWWRRLQAEIQTSSTARDAHSYRSAARP